MSRPSVAFDIPGCWECDHRGSGLVEPCVVGVAAGDQLGCSADLVLGHRRLNPWSLFNREDSALVEVDDRHYQNVLIVVVKTDLGQPPGPFLFACGLVLPVVCSQDAITDSLHSRADTLLGEY